MRRSVLVIGDGSAATPEIYQLLKSEFMPIIGPTIHRCDRLDFQQISSYTSILIVAGDTFPEFSDRFSRLLSQYVSNGGNLVATPFARYNRKLWIGLNKKGGVSLERVMHFAPSKSRSDAPAAWRRLRNAG